MILFCCPVILLHRYHWFSHTGEFAFDNFSFLFTDLTEEIHDWRVYLTPLIFVFTLLIYIFKQLSGSLFGNDQIEMKKQEY